MGTPILSCLAAATLNMNQPLMSLQHRDLRYCPVPLGNTESNTTRLNKRDKVHIGEIRKGSPNTVLRHSCRDRLMATIAL